MRVILKEDIKGVGRANELKKVSDGYARNYLIPKGLAVVADGQTLAKKKIRDKKVERKMANKEGVVHALEAQTLNFSLNTGEKGEIFGSVSKKDIEESLRHRHIEFKEVELKKSIKSSGMHEVKVKLGDGFVANLKVEVSTK